MLTKRLVLHSREHTFPNDDGFFGKSLSLQNGDQEDVPFLTRGTGQ
jgi:hypothetical protein